MLNPIQYYQLARWLYLRRVPILPRLVTRLCEFLFHCYPPYTAEISEGFEVGYHGIGVRVYARRG